MLIQPTQQIAYWLIQSVQEDGATPVGQATGINNALTVISAEGEQAFLRAALSVTAYKPLPDVGQPVEAGRIYGYKNGLIICRQSHTRMSFAPEDTPALWIVYREGAQDVLDWIAGEKVERGMHRMYGGIEYVCIQAHVTQADWTPPATPALWMLYVVTPPSSEWRAGVAYRVADEVMYLGKRYRCRQAHTSQVGWEPPVVPALWRLI